MAHILVYLQRTPLGLHPASAVACCVAREVASARGATVSAICPGMSAEWDTALERAAGRFGCDRLLFVGPDGLRDLVERLRPVHVLVPFTREGLSVGEPLGLGAPTPRWIDTPRPDVSNLDTVTGIVAGHWPWFDLPTTLDAEYTADAGEVSLPPWTGAPGPHPADFRGLAGPPVTHVGPPDLPASAAAALAALGSTPAPLGHAATLTAGTRVWLDAGPAGLPESLAERDPSARLLLLPGPMATFQPSWSLADWVLPGAWTEVLTRLGGPPWAGDAS